MENYNTWRWVVNQKCRTLLTQNLSGRDCAVRLRENPITRSESERILSKVTSEEQVNELLDILISKDRFWVSLLQFLKTSNQERIGKELEDEYRQREVVYSKVENEQIVDRVQTLPNGFCQVGMITYNPQEVLGHGSEGTIVFKGRFHEIDVAVKRVNKDYNNLDREIKVLRISDSHPHPNIIRYFFVEKDTQFRYIALELCKRNLEEYVMSDDYQHDNGHLIKILEQIVAGLYHLHGIGIIHRDIKPQNVLISDTRTGQVRVLITDFGLSKSLDSGKISVSNRTGLSGTSGWMAPEVFSQQSVTPKADIFSLGCVFYFALTKGHHPFDEGPCINVHTNVVFRMHNILIDKYTLDQLNSEDKSFAKLIEKMICHKPEERPSAQDILKHPIFLSHEDASTFEPCGSSKEDQIHNRTTVYPSNQNGISTPQPLATTLTEEQPATPTPHIALHTLRLQEKPKDTAEELRKRGESKRMQRDYQGSLVDLDESLRLEPNNAFALRSRGTVKHMLGDYQGSLVDLNESLCLEPNNAEALRSRGTTKLQLLDYQGSLGDVNESLRLEPNNADALSSRGTAKLLLLDLRGSLVDLNESLRLEPNNAFALRSRGTVKHMLGDHQGSLADLDESLRLKPNDPNTLKLRSDVNKSQILQCLIS